MCKLTEKKNAQQLTANISKLGVSGLLKVCTFNKIFNGLTGEWLGNPSLLILAKRYQILKRMDISKITSKFSLLILSSILIILSSCQKQDTTISSSLKLWYHQPAKASVADDANGWNDDPEWLRALPLGNGSLGAMVFGDVNKERIQLNEESMWSGSPEDNNNPEAHPAQDEIRKLLFKGKYKEATELTQKTQICKGKGSGLGNGANVPFGCFQTLGDLWIDFEKKSTYENYHRELDLEEAVARVSYIQAPIIFLKTINI